MTLNVFKDVSVLRFDALGFLILATARKNESWTDIQDQ